MVRRGGLEPPRSFWSLDFKSSASTNSATPAWSLGHRITTVLVIVYHPCSRASRQTFRSPGSKWLWLMLNGQIVNNPEVSKPGYKPWGTGGVAQGRDYIIANPDTGVSPSKRYKVSGMKLPWKRFERLCLWTHQLSYKFGHVSILRVCAISHC